MNDHLSIRLAVKTITLFRQFIPKFQIVFDDAVVDHAEPSVIAHVGVSVDVRGGTVSGPSCMPDPRMTRQCGAVLRFFAQVCDPAADFRYSDRVMIQNGDSRRVISAVFEFLQPFQQHGSCVLFSGKSYDSAHSSTSALDIRIPFRTNGDIGHRTANALFNEFYVVLRCFGKVLPSADLGNIAVPAFQIFYYGFGLG